jgi:hypothetical protein
MAVHWQDPNVPTNPGQIVVLHGIKRYPRSPGRTGTPWDINIYAWYQDVVAGSAPTVFEFPTGNIAQPRNGALTYRVFDATTLSALFAADPTLVVAPLPENGAAGTEVIPTTYFYPVVPFRYIANSFCQRTNPRQFFELVHPQIVAEGQEAKMAPFIRWMLTTSTAGHDQHCFREVTEYF